MSTLFPTPKVRGFYYMCLLGLSNQTLDARQCVLGLEVKTHISKRDVLPRDRNIWWRIAMSPTAQRQAFKSTTGSAEDIKSTVVSF